MNLATIGTSWITEKFISAAKLTPGINLCAVYSRNIDTAKAFAQKTGIPQYYDNLENLLSDDICDAVYIASPNKLHYEQAKLCLTHGKHVLVEKPATTDTEQSVELMQYAEEKNLIYAEAIMSIHTKAFSLLQKQVEDLGNIRSANFVFCQLSSKYPLYIDGKNPNIFNPDFHTGCLMDIGVYNVYLAAALFGKPQKVTAHSVFLPNGCDACGTAVLQYPGMDVNLVYSKVGQSYAPSEIIGDRGTLQIESVSQLTGIALINKDGKQQLVPPDLTRDEIMGDEARFFVDTVRNGTENNKDFLFAKKTALLVREICDEIRRQNNFLF